MKILNWKENKADIQYTISRMNPKYLIGLYLKAKSRAHTQAGNYWKYDGYDWDTANDLAYKTVRESVYYDGVLFQMSLKSLHDELKRRIEIGQINYNPNEKLNKKRYTVNKEYNK